MHRTIQIRLETTPDQEKILSQTLDASRQCYNAVSEYGWVNAEKNGVALHKATYYDLREKHPELPSQLVISARMKATDALKAAFTIKNQGKKISQPHSKKGSIRYDIRTYRIEKEKGIVGLSTVAGRIKFSFVVHSHVSRWLERTSDFDSAELIQRPSGWWLYVVVSIRHQESAISDKVVGVDLGINRPAVTSDALFLGKRRWKEIEQRYFRLNRKLQSKGTKSAKRHLKKMARRRGRFRRDCDHVLSKRIVQSVEPGSVIVIENLTDIRTRTKQKGRKQRRRHHGWSYAQLRRFVTYKGEEANCKVIAVDPRHTSQRCSKCGHVHKKNRPTQSVFKCTECGYEVNADLNAARNVAWKYLAEAGMSGFGGHPVNVPIVGEVEHSCSSSAHKQIPSGISS